MSDLTKVILDTAGRTSGGEAADDWLRKALPYSSRAVEESLGTITRQLEQLRTVGQAQVDAVGQNTQAIALNTQVQAGKGAGSAAAEVAKTASKFLGGGLGLMPLLSGLIGLFKRDKPEQPPLVPYVPPQALRLDGAVAQSTHPPILQVDYGQDGLPRAVQQSGSTYAPQITVQVQAMDSRSFLDHSAEIARAVREAMLNAHSLNDVLNEL